MMVYPSRSSRYRVSSQAGQIIVHRSVISIYLALVSGDYFSILVALGSVQTIVALLTCSVQSGTSLGF